MVETPHPPPRKLQTESRVRLHTHSIRAWCPLAVASARPAKRALSTKHALGSPKLVRYMLRGSTALALLSAFRCRSHTIDDLFCGHSRLKHVTRRQFCARASHEQMYTTCDLATGLQVQSPDCIRRLAKRYIAKLRIIASREGLL